MDIVEALKNHHDEIRDLFSKTKEDARHWDKLKKSLEVHHTNEEKYLLDKAKKKSEIKDESLESIEEHHAIVLLMEDLDNFPKDDERWNSEIHRIPGLILIDHHFEEEEDELFEKACKKLDDEDLEKLGEEYTKTKQEQLAVL